SRTASYRTEPSSGSTDANGVLTVFVKNKEKETVTITPTVTNNRVRTTGETAQVEFVNQFPCQGGGFNCLPMVEDNVPGKLYTPSPEKVFVEAVGFTPDTYYTENGSYGPSDFQSARMTWDKVNAWCRTLTTIKHAGRTNWRMPSKDELVGLYGKYGNMFTARGWPAGTGYWSATDNGSLYYRVSLASGSALSYGPSFAVYASCVSNPPADLDSAHFDATSGLVIDKNNATSNGKEYNQLTATLTDAHGVPVQGVQVTVSLTEGGSVAGSAEVTYRMQVTNDEGKAIIRITNTETETVSVKVMASVGETVVESTAKEVVFERPSIVTDRFPCPDGGFNCLPVVEDNVPGKLYTPSPEKVFVKAVGFTPDTYYTENGSNGPSGFQAARMDWNNVNAWCRTLTTIKHAGRTNWRMPSKDELVGLHGKYGNMFSARGWSTNDFYWSATADGFYNYYVHLNLGSAGSYGQSGAAYASCVSNP
uniref:Ig-like domain-containing protein n=1 Tax=Vibrio vulnificus TaxID=672 RepID=UPI001029A36D